MDPLVSPLHPLLLLLLMETSGSFAKEARGRTGTKRASRSQVSRRAVLVTVGGHMLTSVLSECHVQCVVILFFIYCLKNQIITKKHDILITNFVITAAVFQ